MIPKEGGMLLYRGLLKDQRNSSLYQVRKHVHSSERERMRVLQILKLLDAPKCQPASGMKKKIPPVESKKQKANNTCSIVLSSPYHNCVKKSRKRLQKPSQDRKSRMLIERTHKTSKRLIVKDSDYIWHPMTIASTSNKKKEEVVLDVMKYYRNQYIRVQEKGKKKQKSNQTLLS